jgi:hypothetical protein
MYLTEAVQASRVIKDPLRGRRLTSIDVSHDADVAISIERNLLTHSGLSLIFPSGLGTNQGMRLKNMT